MAAARGNFSGFTQIQNSRAEENFQDLMDQRKRMRMQSNRESARRSRMQKQNSHAEENFQDLMDQRKRMRMQSNRESARRSRIQKQKRLDDLTAQIAQLRNKNSHILTSLNLTTQDYMKMEAENLVLKAQFMELNQRLQSLNEILNYIKSNNNPMFEDFQGCPESLMHFCQWPTMASADAFYY